MHKVFFEVKVIIGCIRMFTVDTFCCIADSDYSQVGGVPLSFTGTNGMQCSSIPILDDTIVELDESFSVLLSTSNPAVNLIRDSASVSVRDNDTVTISWSPASYEVLEDGRAATVCAQITEGEIDRQVIVSYSTRDGTAQGNNKSIYTLGNNECISCNNIICLPRFK